MARFASEEVKAELIKVANQLIENGKGLLAADEGHPVVGARLEKVTYEKFRCFDKISHMNFLKRPM